MSENTQNGPERSPEKATKGPKLIGIIGPHAIGKDTIANKLKETMVGDVKVFSVGRYINENLISADEETRKDFIDRLTESGLESEDQEMNIIRGQSLIDEIEHTYHQHVPIPQEVADWILRDFIAQNCDEDTTILMPGGPYSEIDLRFFERHTPPSGIILLAPTIKEWHKELPKREQRRSREGFVPDEYDSLLEWDKWRSRAVDVLRYAHKRNYPVMHLNMKNPNLNEDVVSEQVVQPLVNFIEKLNSDEHQLQLQKIDVE